MQCKQHYVADCSSSYQGNQSCVKDDEQVMNDCHLVSRQRVNVSIIDNTAVITVLYWLGSHCSLCLLAYSHNHTMMMLCLLL